jgi:hypothetical protein
MGCISAYLVTALLMPRSILTEKLSRLGYHLTREYGVDPLELVIVSELMSPAPQVETFAGSAVLPELFTYSDGTCRGAAELMATEGVASIPVVDRATHRISGTLTLQDLLRGRSKAVVRERERVRLFSHSNGAGGGQHN